MTNKNDNRKQPHTGNSKGNDSEFAMEFNNLSKKARKKAAREAKKE